MAGIGLDWMGNPAAPPPAAAEPEEGEPAEGVPEFEFKLAEATMGRSPSQVFEYYEALKGRGVRAEMRVYPHDSHALSRPATAADSAVHTARFLADTLLAAPAAE